MTSTEVDLDALPLRDRKKALTKAAIVAAAERLFEERGYDNVTVAEIANAANVSVKTLFVYFRSKEDLVFTDTWLIDAILTALRDRPDGQSPAQAVVQVLLNSLSDDGSGIEDFHRGYGDSEALRSGMLRMWAEYEDKVTAVLAERSGGPATPDARFDAIQLVGLIRAITSPEVRALSEPAAALRKWLRSTARTLQISAPDTQ